MNKNREKILNLTYGAIIAALYVVITELATLVGLSSGAIQFRISEALMLLCFFKKDYIISMTLGCFIANLFSPLGLIDAVFGTVATLIAVILIYVCRERCGLFAVSLFPVITNCIFSYTNSMLNSFPFT